VRNASALAAGVGAALLAGGNPVHAQDKGIEVKLSGQINRAILHADDGGQKDWFNVDNDNSSTRFRFDAAGNVRPGLRAGILFEVEYQSNPSNLVNFAGRQVSPSLDERHMDVFVNGGWGTVRLGQGDGAANGAAEVDLSGTAVAHYSETTGVGGGFLYRNSAGVLTTSSITTTLANQDFESRYDMLLYQSPVFSGFIAETSWGNKATDIFELALRYSGKLDAALGTLAGALGYSREDAVPGGVDDKIFGGSISWLHSSGMNLTFAHTNRDLPGREGKFTYLKAGYKFNNRHAASVDFGQGDDQEAGGDEATMFGLGYVYTPIAWAEVFGLVKRHDLDRPGASLHDITFAMIGSRVKF
jgi:hypothetical protein